MGTHTQASVHTHMLLDQTSRRACGMHSMRFQEGSAANAGHACTHARVGSVHAMNFEPGAKRTGSQEPSFPENDATQDCQHTGHACAMHLDSLATRGGA